MISVEEAIALIAAQSRDFGEEVVLLQAAAGRILAQEVFADRDFPPYDRVTMDGIAIVYSSWKGGTREFSIAGMQAAGQTLQSLEDARASMEVATGAVLPEGTDTVIPYEDCSISDGVARITVDVIQSGQNIHGRGTDSKAGDLLLRKDTIITPAAIAVLATVGASQVKVRRLPRVAICVTGDELVEIDEQPAAHQIRRSNSYMLAAALEEDSITADAYHLPDNEADMRGRLGDLLPRYDVLLLSGAVSKGAFDFLPGVLKTLGMESHFHRIAQKPGKPMLAGSFTDGPVVFGFPGNPVSTMVCYAIYFRHWLHGSLRYETVALSARLTTDVEFLPKLTYHLLVKLRMYDGVLEATPCTGANSGDLISLSAANAIITLPSERQRFAAGESYPLRFLAPFF